MTPMKLLSLSFVLLCGCASLRLPQAAIPQPPAEKDFPVFSELNLEWENKPLRSAADEIGEGTLFGPPKQEYFPVEQEIFEIFRSAAIKQLEKEGLYKAGRGGPALTLRLKSRGRWTYKEILRTYLVETPFIMIFPSSLYTRYELEAEWREGEKTRTASSSAGFKTVFHLLLFPVYPFTPPSAAEKKCLKSLIAETAAGIKAGGDEKLPAGGGSAGVVNGGGGTQRSLQTGG